MSDDLEHGIRYSPNPPDPTGPRIIRTAEELEALDPDTAVMDCDTTGGLYFVRQHRDAVEYEKTVYERYLPAVVIRDGAEVRAARKALEKETTDD